MRIRSDYTAALAGMVLGAGVAGAQPEGAHTFLTAMLGQRPAWQVAPSSQPRAASPMTAPAGAAVAQDGRWGAESVELRTLRRAEERLFADEPAPEPASLPTAPPAESCEAPAAADWQTSSDARASQPRWPSGLKMPGIPVRQNARVAKYIRYFSGSAEGRNLFTNWLRRSGRYRTPITTALEQHQLPRDLLSIVFVESGFWPTAVSSAGAVGLWQFMPQTAKAYGLKVERGYDERQTIFQATSAAVDHLSDLYARFQSWDLALAAYNMGYASLGDRLQQYGVDDFWSLAQIPDALPKETALYVPKVLAVAVLLNNLDYFGFGDVELARGIDAAQLEVPSGTRLSVVARAAGTSARALRELNPQVHGDVMPDRGEPLTVYVPGNGLARARSMLPILLSRQESGDLDRQVSSDFDWGHDELDANGQTRLERTNPRRGNRDAQRPFWETMADDRPARDAAPPLDHADRGTDSPNREGDSDPGPGDHQRAAAQRLLRSAEPSDREDDTARPRAGEPPATWRIRAEDPRLQPPAPSSRLNSAHDDPEADNIRGALGIDKAGQRVSEHVVEYRVMHGDNLTGVAAAFSTTPRQVARDNHIRNPSHIVKGQVLRLRVQTATAATTAESPTIPRTSAKQPPS